MFIAIWEYTVPVEKREAFEKLYNQQGEWCQLFRKSPHYLNTEFYQKTDNTYLTIDKWTDGEAYHRFYKEHEAEVNRIDALGDSLTSSENKIGEYSAC